MLRHTTAMTPAEADWRRCPALADKDAAFLALVAGFLEQLEALNDDQKQRLALFKAAELLNAVIQIREQRDHAERLGPALAKVSFERVRSVIRNRSLSLAGSEPVSLRDPAVQALIDQGCRLFHLGKSDPDTYERALALSAAQCLVLNPWLDPALDRYGQGCGFAVPPALLDAVRQAFVTAYRS